MSSERDVEVNKTPTKKRKYHSHYNLNWENQDDFRGWLMKSLKGSEFAYCKVCAIDLFIGKGGKTDLSRHKGTKKHENNKIKMRGQRSLDQLPNIRKNTGTEKLVKEGEIRMAAFVVEHNLPISIMDQLPQLIKTVCPDSEIGKNINCGRTKTTKLITDVLGKTDMEVMIEAMQNNKFSLSVDESTDKSTTKHLAAIVRVCRNNYQIEDYFFDLFEIQDGTAEKMYDIITKKMVELNIPYKNNMIGLAADGANVMMGRNNSLATRFKAEIPHVFIMKCVCHSIHLVASNACLKLPREPEDLARDIYNYLNGSPKRLGQFKEFQQFLDLKPHRLLQPSQVRWLSLEAVVKRLLEQYEALKLYFRDAVFTDRIKAAETILIMLENPVNKLYLEFLEYTLEIFNILNRLMQSEKSNIHAIHDKVVSVIYTFLECYVKEEHISRGDLKNIDYKNPRKYMQIGEWYLGAKVASTLATTTIDPESVKNFKLRCLEFYIESVKQLLQRFPFEGDMAMLEKMKFIDPKEVLDRKIKSIADILQRFPNIVPPSNFQKVDTEWRLLRNTPLNIDGNESVEKFWKIIANMECGDGNKMFLNLTDFVFNLLCLPHSSASVERLFSQINLSKTKLRNKLSTDVIAGILHTKNILKNTNACALEIKKEMLSKHSCKIYK